MIRSFEMRKWGHLIKPRISLQFFASAALALIAALGVGDAFAQAPPQSKTATVDTAASQFWTPQRLLNAKPIELIPPADHKLLPLSVRCAAWRPI
jgi:hypothetical protein